MGVTAKSQTIAALTALAPLAGCHHALSPAPYAPPTGQGGGLTVIPRSATIQAGQGVVLKATLRDENGDIISGRIKWSSNNEAVAAVTTTGEVLGRSAGHAIIAASADGRIESSFI